MKPSPVSLFWGRCLEGCCGAGLVCGFKVRGFKVRGFTC